MASDELHVGGLCRRTAGRDAALGLPGDTRSPAASLDTHAFDETANSHNQSTSEVAHWYETSTLTALGPGGTPYDHVSAGLPLQVHSVTRSETGFRWDLLSGAFDQ